jgi:topoisomerase-4 subunit A
MVTTSTEPEVEMEVIKGKDKLKEVVNLEDIIDVKGWKAMGNRLSQYKVTKVQEVKEEDTGLEEGDEDNDLVDAKTTETGKGSPSSKKKSSAEDEREPERHHEPAPQAKLFEEEPKQPKRQKKETPKQANLFQKEEVKNDKAYKPGQTIEFDL